MSRLRLPALALLVAPACLYSQETTRIPARSPVVLFGKRVNVVVAAPRALAQVSDSLSVMRALESCPPAIRGASAVAYANKPTIVQGAARDDRVVFLLVPTPGSFTDCDATAHWDPALLTRAVQIVPPSTFESGSDLRTVEVSARGQLVPLDSSARRPVVSIFESAQSTQRPSQIATWVAARYIAPDAAGRLPEVTLRVSTADSSPPDVVTLAGEALRDVWHDLIVVRIENLGDARMVHEPMRLPVPNDKRLRDAHALYSAGQVVAAARIAEQRLAAGQLSSGDARAARMLIFGTLLAYDDSSAARVVLADVLADAPCLTLSDGPTERLLDAMRPPAHCSVTPSRRILLASFIPGMGYAVSGHQPLAVVSAAATSVGFVVAWSLEGNANQAYRRYLDARSTPEVTSAYSDASRNRRDARFAMGFAAGTWLLAGTTALVAEQFHARSLARVRDYDVQPTVGLQPDLRGGEARIAMSVTW